MVAVRVTDKATGSDWEGPHVSMWAAAPGRRGALSRWRREGQRRRLTRKIKRWWDARLGVGQDGIGRRLV